MRCYVLFFRNKKGEIKAFPELFYSAEHLLNIGNDLMPKEKWIDFNYRVVEPPEILEVPMSDTRGMKHA